METSPCASPCCGGGTIARLVLEQARREAPCPASKSSRSPVAALARRPRRWRASSASTYVIGRRGVARAAPRCGARGGFARRGARAPGRPARGGIGVVVLSGRRARRRRAARRPPRRRPPLRRAALRSLRRHRRPRCAEDRLPRAESTRSSIQVAKPPAAWKGIPYVERSGVALDRLDRAGDAVRGSGARGRAALSRRT